MLIRIGGSASSVSANSDGAKPVPSIGMTSASTASDGSVRPMLAVVIAASAARGLPASRDAGGNRDRDRDRRAPTADSAT